MVLLKFSDLFWSQDFLSTQGFEILTKRIKDGKTASKELESFVRERSKIEEDYAKALAKLGKTVYTAIEQGSIGECFVVLREQVDRTARCHFDMSIELQNQATRLLEFRKSQSAACKQQEDVVKRLQNQKKDLHVKMLTSQTNYQKKYAAYEHAKVNYCEARSSEALKGTKEIEKLDQRQLKSHEELIKADESYKTLVQLLESTRASWEKEMKEMCDLFQTVEEQRMSLIRKELWIHVNCDSVTLYEQDQGNNNVRSTMEKCDTVKDLQDFITAYHIGTKRPEPIPYMSCSPPTKRSLVDNQSIPYRPAVSNNSYGSAAFDPTYASIGE